MVGALRHSYGHQNQSGHPRQHQGLEGIGDAEAPAGLLGARGAEPHGADDPHGGPQRRHGRGGRTTQRRAQFADGQRRLTIDNGRLAREGGRSTLDPAGVSTILRTQESVPKGEVKPEVLVLVVVVNRMMGWTNNPPS